MSVYYNLVTNEYPKHIGDVQASFPEYKPGDPLPGAWVEVAQSALPEIAEDDVGLKQIVELLPQKVNGVWSQRFVVKDAAVTMDEAVSSAKAAHQSYIDHIMLTNPGWVPPTE